MNDNSYVIVRTTDNYIVAVGFEPGSEDNIIIDKTNYYFKRISNAQFKQLSDLGRKDYRYDLPTEEVVEIPQPPVDDKNYAWYDGQWQDVTSVAELWSRLRLTRNRLLEITDITILRLNEQNLPVAESIKTYRQQLRDLPETVVNPAQVSWPVPPEGYGLPTSAIAE